MLLLMIMITIMCYSEWIYYIRWKRMFYDDKNQFVFMLSWELMVAWNHIIILFSRILRQVHCSYSIKWHIVEQMLLIHIHKLYTPHYKKSNIFFFLLSSRSLNIRDRTFKNFYQNNKFNIFPMTFCRVFATIRIMHLYEDWKR